MTNEAREHAPDCVFWLDDDSDLTAYGPEGCCTCHVYRAEREAAALRLFAEVERVFGPPIHVTDGEAVKDGEAVFRKYPPRSA